MHPASWAKIVCGFGPAANPQTEELLDSLGRRNGATAPAMQQPRASECVTAWVCLNRVGKYKHQEIMQKHPTFITIPMNIHELQLLGLISWSSYASSLPGEVGEFSAGIGYIGAIDHLPKAWALMELLYMSWVWVRIW